MTFPRATFAVTTAFLAFYLLLPAAAQAAIVRSTNGTPVLSSNGNCVISNWEGSDECDAAKAGTAKTTDQKESSKVDHEHVVYFDFNKASLTAEARHKLDHIAKKIEWMHKHDHVKTEINIVGFADRLGNADYDQKLALKRAKAVRDYLVGKGVKAKKMEVRSLGKSEPMANCPPDMKRAKLIDCLKEDRRVEIEVTSHP